MATIKVPLVRFALATHSLPDCQHVAATVREAKIALEARATVAEQAVRRLTSIL